jgi:hypothetical protein
VVYIATSVLKQAVCILSTVLLKHNGNTGDGINVKGSIPGAGRDDSSHRGLTLEGGYSASYEICGGGEFLTWGEG